mgnify:CR=1 FL=1
MEKVRVGSYFLLTVYKKKVMPIRMDKEKKYGILLNQIKLIATIKSSMEKEDNKIQVGKQNNFR